MERNKNKTIKENYEKKGGINPVLPKQKPPIPPAPIPPKKDSNNN